MQDATVLMMNANTLMLTHVLHALPTARHHALVCSSGSKGYHALKKMLQNGIPGHTLLIESSDLRDVEDDGSGEHRCCLLYNLFEEQQYTNVELPGKGYKEHIMPSVSKITVFSNSTTLPWSFLHGCAGLTAINLTPLTHVSGGPKGLPRGMHWADCARFEPLLTGYETIRGFPERMRGPHIS